MIILFQFSSVLACTFRYIVIIFMLLVVKKKSSCYFMEKKNEDVRPLECQLSIMTLKTKSSSVIISYDIFCYRMNYLKILQLIKNDLL